QQPVHLGSPLAGADRCVKTGDVERRSSRLTQTTGGRLGMASADAGIERMTNPIDIVEDVAHAHDWACDRTAEDEVTLIVAGSWTDYHVSLNWREDIETLHLACAFDFKVPENRLAEIYRLIAQINEQLWLGHFD